MSKYDKMIERKSEKSKEKIELALQSNTRYAGNKETYQRSKADEETDCRGDSFIKSNRPGIH